MKHAEHIVQENDVLKFLESKNATFRAQNPNEQTDECPFIMKIFSTF